MRKNSPLHLPVTVLILSLFTFNLGCGSGSQSQSVNHTQNPLVAEYEGYTSCGGAVSVEFGPDTSYGRRTAWYPTAGAGPTGILVAGMQASTTYHMAQQSQCGTSVTTSADITFTTGALPSNMPFPTLTIARPNPSASSPENPGIELVDVISANDNLMQAFFIDRNGNPIWYYPMAYPYSPETIKFLPNGHLIFSLVSGPDSLLREVDLAGNTIREMDISVLAQKVQAAGFDFVPANMHHDLLPLPNGHLIVLVNFTKDVSNVTGYPGVVPMLGDGLIDLDQNWNPVWGWNAFDWLDVNRHLNGLPDWTHSNALQYTADGNILISMRHQSWILKLDYNNGTGSGNILWHLGYQGDFTLTQNGAVTTDPALWFSFQHFPSIISQDGQQITLAVWDNGDNRVLDNNGDVCQEVPPPAPDACYSRPVIFNVDEATMMANINWTDPLPWFGIWGGSINQLENGNVEFDLNAPLVPPASEVASQVQEVTQTATPQVVWQMQISPVNQTAYRAYRVPSLYPGITWQF